MAPPRTSSRLAVYESSSPAQLAAQPAILTKGMMERNTAGVNNEWGTLRQHLEARLNMGRAWRFSWAQHWQLLENYLLPRRGIFVNVAQPTPNSMNRGVPINTSILDPTGTLAMRVCAAGLLSGLMSPSRPWYKLKPAMAPRSALGNDVLMWFEDVEDRMSQVMARSNFYDSAAQMFEDLTTFGSGPMIIYEDVRDIIRCFVPCPGEYFLYSSPSFRVESMYRQFVMTVAQIVEMFKLENCPADVRGLWRSRGGSLEVERLVAHAIEPNFPINDYKGGETGVVKGGFTWREAYWVWGTASAQPLSLRGFKDQPHVCPRWATTSNDPYGRSLGMDVLPDIMQLQVMVARKDEAIEKLVRPPLLASMELKNEPSSILPGHVTYVGSLGADKGMRPIYEVNPEIKEMIEGITMLQQRIEKGFFKDLFMNVSQLQGDRRTAYEISQRKQEELQVLGPVIERFHNEFASNAIKRIFRIMERKKLLPPLPQGLQGIPLSIEYVSMMALAQKATSTAAMERYAQIAGSLGAVYPLAKHKLSPLGFMNEYADQLGVPRTVVASDDEANQQVQAEQQQMQAQQAASTGMAAVQGAETLSNTKLGGGGSALDMMLGQSPAAGNA
jgi:hypothetical protein